MKYNKGDIIQEGDLKGCKVLDFYYEREMPYASWYDVEFKEGKHRRFKAIEVEPDNLEFDKQAYLKQLEERRNSRYTHDKYGNVVNVRIFNTKTKILDENVYSFSNKLGIPLKVHDYVSVKVKQEYGFNKMHDVPAVVVETNVSKEDIRYAENQAHLKTLTNITGKLPVIYGFSKEEWL